MVNHVCREDPRVCPHPQLYVPRSCPDVTSIQWASMRFEYQAVVEGAVGEVFSLTQDYERRLTWDPFLRSAVLLDGAAAPAVGVRAWCVAHEGFGMETEYVTFRPPRRVAVKMTRGPRILESFAGTWEFESIPDGKTRVTFRYHLRVRP